jgi:hypothetical protein
MTIVMGMAEIILNNIKNSITNFSSLAEDDLYKYKLTKIRGNEFILYQHLGLGDVIINNGLVHYLSENFEKIYLIVDKRFSQQIDYLFSENKKIQVTPVTLREVNNADKEVIQISNEMNLEILKVGFSYIPGMRFYKSFYKQLHLPYKYSHTLFSQQRNHKKEAELYDHLLNFYNIENENYNLVHSQASNMNFDLDIQNNFDVIYVEKESDIFGNIFLYNKVIEKATEIHCINSSFCHFVDRTNRKNSLYYHDLRGSKLELAKDWKVIDYGN